MVERLAVLSQAELRELFEKLQLGELQLRQMCPAAAAEDVTRLYEALAGGEMADVYDLDNAIAVAKRISVRWLPFVAIRSGTLAHFGSRRLSEDEARKAESALLGMTTEEGFEDLAWYELRLLTGLPQAL